MTLLIDMKKNIILLLLFFSCVLAVAQDLKTTEIKVIEALKVSVPDAFKLNTKASFSDTTKQDKTQKYSFIDQLYYSNFTTRSLVAAKIKSKAKFNFNSTSIRLSLGNYSFKSANITYNSKYNKSFSYGLRLVTNNNKYTTEEYEYSVKNNSQRFYFFTKSILSKNIISSSLNYEKLVAQHDFSNTFNNDNENQFTYSKLLCSIKSREAVSKGFTHETSLFFTDLNSFTENHFSLYSNIRKQSAFKPISLLIEYDNYLNYSNDKTSYGRDKTDAKIVDFTPSIFINKDGFDIDFGFNLGFENSSNTNKIDVFPEIKISKEFVEDILNMTFGIHHTDYRNSIYSLSKENPYIYSFGLNSGGVGDTINYTHELRTTDLYEAYYSLNNKLSQNEMLSFEIGFGKEFDLHYYDFDTIPYYHRFSVNYIDIWQLRVNGEYSRKFNNLLSMNLNIDYFNWFDAIVPHRSNLLGSLKIPFTLRNKIKAIPSLSYFGERDAHSHSSEFELIQLDEQYLINLSVSYNYSKNLGFYIDFNNLSNSKKQLWNGYQQIGLNMVFGLNCLF